MPLLEKVVEVFTVFDSGKDRRDILMDMQDMIDNAGPYQFCKSFDALSNSSAEDFMIEFMTAFNKECFHCY